jgi:NADPH-dependent curcumin reductase CurA
VIGSGAAGATGSVVVEIAKALAPKGINWCSTMSAVKS